MPGFEELHIAKVGDGSFILRTDKQVVVTAQNFGQVTKRAREFFFGDSTVTELLIKAE